MDSFEKAFAGLNDIQRAAVTTLEGPILVIAGPGTGKTQLVTTRIGHILKSTDTLPSNILCLTFTEAGVEAMRDRLNLFLGQSAYEVNISTYHAFGSEIIRRYPEYFEAGLEPIDDLESFTILRSIISRLPYSNPLKFADAQLPDILRFISDSKRALLLPNDVRAIARNNQKHIEELNKATGPVLGELGVISKKSLPIFERLLPLMQKSPTQNIKMPGSVRPLAYYAANSLKEALAEVDASGKTTPITVWKNAWLAKDQDGNFVFAGQKQNEKLEAAAGVYEQYQANLAKRRLYDYDDMILRAIDVLQSRPELKYTIAEQYLYIMLDEFQDTNPAQMRLIELLTDHPVLEGRPNVLAVGDDDQAIYAFQGADHANMAEFARHYKGVEIITLEENYRSYPEILETASNIAGQISDRLHQHFEGVSKNIIAASKDLPQPKLLQAREFKSDAAEYEWVANEVKRLIDDEHIAPSDIAVLAPRHRNLMSLIPYLGRVQLPVRYERRDNVLDAPLVRQLEQMSRLTILLGDNQDYLADGFWPEVLSYGFWGLKTEDIWQVSWEARRSEEPWTQTLLKTAKTKNIALFFLRLKDVLSITTLEQQLDILVGLPEISAQFKMPITSPFFEYYFGDKAADDGAGFIELLGHLSSLRYHLWQRQRVEEEPLGLADFIIFIEEYRAAGLNILDTNAYRETEEAVNVLTAYASKGREFRAVFLINSQDEVWGAASRTRGQYLSLPTNLQFIRYQGASEDERLRLLYVAITRAKTHLYLTGYTHTLAGKASRRLKYLDIREDENGVLRCYSLPEDYDQVQTDSGDGISLEASQDYWSARHEPPFKPNLHTYLANFVKQYQLSATHVNKFIDVTSGGPHEYLLSCILQFPKAVPYSARYGTAMHETIRFAYQAAIREKRTPTLEVILQRFEERLNRQKLATLDHELFLERGRGSLTAWLSQKGNNFKPTDKFEFGFRREASFVGLAHLSGNVDRMRIDSKNRTIIVTDFKTGQPYQKWVNSNIRLYKYRQQLIFYKLLIENSRDFKNYGVEKGIIEFVEPDELGNIVQLELDYDETEVEYMRKLIGAIWQHVQKLDFPDISSYPQTVAGIKQFEQDLIDKVIK